MEKTFQPIGAVITMKAVATHPNCSTQQTIKQVFDPLPTLTDLFTALEPQLFLNRDAGALTLASAQESWRRMIAAMTQLLRQTMNTVSVDSRSPLAAEVCNQQGIVFCAPAPVFSDLAILAHVKTWVFTPQRQSGSFQLPPAVDSEPISEPIEVLLPTLPLLAGDSLAHEQFCLLQTPQFCWVAVLSHDAEGVIQLNFSFSPATVEQIWKVLQVRIDRLQNPVQSGLIESWRSQFPAIAPDYRIPMQFSQALLAQASYPTPPRVQMPERSHPWVLSSPCRPIIQTQTQPEAARDVELLKVLAHEVRTPLTTIQTLTRLLLRRSDLPNDVLQRLDAIQRECSGQIDRFGLIFRAMELTYEESQPLPIHLTPLALHSLLADNLTRWQNHAARRGLTLQVTTPKRLPEVAIRDPHLLNQVLTGLMEYLSNSLCAGSHINLKVALAGSQLKLQLETQPDEASCSGSTESPMMKAVGQFLMFQPETGGVSLSLAATKHLFQFLGGKLTVRRQFQSEVLTIFLPLGTESDAY
jgi:hypothetical protein